MMQNHINGLSQDYGISIVDAMGALLLIRINCNPHMD